MPPPDTGGGRQQLPDLSHAPFHLLPAFAAGQYAFDGGNQFSGRETVLQELLEHRPVRDDVHHRVKKPR